MFFPGVEPTTDTENFPCWIEKGGGVQTFVVKEPFYDVCESWAEEPDSDAWDAVYPAALLWLIRTN